MRFRLILFASASLAVACGDDAPATCGDCPDAAGDASSDSATMDAGPGNDGGPGSDAGPGNDAGPGSDAATDGAGGMGPDVPELDAGLPDLESLRNTDPLFRQHEDATSAELRALGFASDDFTEPQSQPDNGPGPGGQGQFRLGCQWSHFGYEDPIIQPGRPGGSHLHMFWGNTRTDAFTVFNDPSNAGDPNDILENGGSTCQGFELNRSAYWIPALLDARTPGHVVIPDTIILYYKSHRPYEVNPLPAGVQLVAGNIFAGGRVEETFVNSSELYWSCGQNGSPYNRQSTIPTNCNAGDPINATISFPQCLAVDGAGAPVLTSPDFVSHTAFVPQNEACPASHPYRVPQISYLIYWPNGTDGAGAGVDDWVLSSDGREPGGSLHGDWLGGWHDEAIQTWIDGCFDPNGRFDGPRNCSIGQTGTNRSFRRVSRLNDFDGENFLPFPR